MTAPRKFNPGDDVVSAGPSRWKVAGKIVTVAPRGRVKVRWPDGTERWRSVGTLRKAPAGVTP